MLSAKRLQWVNLLTKKRRSYQVIANDLAVSDADSEAAAEDLDDGPGVQLSGCLLAADEGIASNRRFL